MWVISKEGLIIIGVVAILGVVGLVLLLQPGRPSTVTPDTAATTASTTVPAPATSPALPPIAPTHETTPATSASVPVAAIDGVIYGGEYAHSTEAAGFYIYWSNDATVLRVGLVSPGLGYLAIGFDPVSRMQGANFILGAVVDGQTVVRDDYGTGAVAHSADVANGGTHDIIAAAGCEAGGKTYLEFSIPLDSGDAMDKPLAPGGTYKVIIAYHDANDDFAAWHSRRGAGTITLDPAP